MLALEPRFCSSGSDSNYPDGFSRQRWKTGAHPDHLPTSFHHWTINFKIITQGQTILLVKSLKISGLIHGKFVNNTRNLHTYTFHHHFIILNKNDAKGFFYVLLPGATSWAYIEADYQRYCRHKLTLDTTQNCQKGFIVFMISANSFISYISWISNNYNTK